MERMTPHVPLAPDPFFAWLHAWQVPLHAVLQQRPSTQKPLEHSAFCVHARPCARSPHWPRPLQLVVPGHSTSGSVPVVTLEHVPFAAPVLAIEHAVQVNVQAALQQKPSTQNPLWHCEASVQAAPFAASHAPAPLQSPAAHSLSGS